MDDSVIIFDEEEEDEDEEIDDLSLIHAADEIERLNRYK
jgi:hypothetical protein